MRKRENKKDRIISKKQLTEELDYIPFSDVKEGFKKNIVIRIHY